MGRHGKRWGSAVSHTLRSYFGPVGESSQVTNPLFAPVSWHIKTDVVSPPVTRGDPGPLQEHGGFWNLWAWIRERGS